MKSFQIRIAQNLSCVDGDPGTRLITWGTPGQYFWSLVLTPNNQTSLYNLQGFKNINIFGVSMNGLVVANNAGRAAVIDDWGFLILIDGTPALVSGEKRTAVNGFNLTTTGLGLNAYSLSKNTNSVVLSDPITSAKSIEFLSLYAQGVGAQFLSEITFNYLINFTFYYKYEGEE